MNVPDGSREKTSLPASSLMPPAPESMASTPYTVNRHQTNTSFIDSEKEKTK